MRFAIYEYIYMYCAERDKWRQCQNTPSHRPHPFRYRNGLSYSREMCRGPIAFPGQVQILSSG